jgi:plastocyanin
MKTIIRSTFTTTGAIAFLAMLVWGQSAWATTYVVELSDSTFAPSLFDATVGDTIMWNGDFTRHTTTSTSVPPGAAAWNFGQVSATTFSYVIQAVGVYNYRDNADTTRTMVGSFTAGLLLGPKSSMPQSGAGTDGRISVIAVAKTGNPVVQFFVPSTQPVTLEIINLRGESVATVINTTLSAGTYTVPIGNKIRAAGVYFFKLNGRGAEHHGAIRLL